MRTGFSSRHANPNPTLTLPIWTPPKIKSDQKFWRAEKACSRTLTSSAGIKVGRTVVRADMESADTQAPIATNGMRQSAGRVIGV
jgi:hypothetical protein